MKQYEFTKKFNLNFFYKPILVVLKFHFICTLSVRMRVTYSEVMMDFMNVLVDSAMMQGSVEEVMPCVLNYSTTKTLGQYIRPEMVREIINMKTRSTCFNKDLVKATVPPKDFVCNVIDLLSRFNHFIKRERCSHQRGMESQS